MMQYQLALSGGAAAATSRTAAFAAIATNMRCGGNASYFAAAAVLYLSLSPPSAHMAQLCRIGVWQPPFSAYAARGDTRRYLQRSGRRLALAATADKAHDGGSVAMYNRAENMPYGVMRRICRKRRDDARTSFSLTHINNIGMRNALLVTA